MARLKDESVEAVKAAASIVEFVAASKHLRARATVRGAELARLAVGRAAADGSARELLRWSERWRATLQVAPPPRPPQHPEALAELAALRALARMEGEDSNGRREGGRRRPRVGRLAGTGGRQGGRFRPLAGDREAGAGGERHQHRADRIGWPGPAGHRGNHRPGPARGRLRPPRHTGGVGRVGSLDVAAQLLAGAEPGLGALQDAFARTGPAADRGQPDDPGAAASAPLGAVGGDARSPATRRCGPSTAPGSATWRRTASSGGTTRSSRRWTWRTGR